MSDVNDTVEPGDEASMASVTSDSTSHTEEQMEEPVQELSMDEVTLNIISHLLNIFTLYDSSPPQGS